MERRNGGMAQQGEGEDAAIEQFMAFTGKEAADAHSYLDAANWDVQAAVELCFAADEATGGRVQTDFGAAGPDEHAEPAGNTHAAASTEGEEVRQPDEVVREQLVGSHLDEAVNRRGLAAFDEPMGAPDPFAGMRARAAIDHDGNAMHDDDDEETENGDTASHDADLGSIFRPPVDLTFKGTFEDAKIRARQLGRWLLANVQAQAPTTAASANLNRNPAFDSSRLNRDTWSHDHVRQVLTGSFVLYQRNNNDVEGSKLCMYYSLNEAQLPAVLVIDPVTGALMKHVIGYIEPHRLLEEVLLPFMERQPIEPLKEVNTNETHGSNKQQEEHQKQTEKAQHGDVSSSDAAFQQTQDANPKCDQLRNEAEARLGPEPSKEEGGTVRVAIKLPEGQRLNRRFMPSDTVGYLKAYVQSQHPLLAAGQGFTLSHATPGSSSLDDDEQTLQDASVAGTMLLVRKK